MAKCTKCGVEINFSNRICYNNEYMCPNCVYEVAQPGSTVRWQMGRNYAEYLERR